MSKRKKEEGNEISVPLICSMGNEFFEVKIGKRIKSPNLCFCIYSNGIYKINKNIGHNVIEKAESISQFDLGKSTSTHNYPEISYKVFSVALAFLREVFEKYESEGNVLLALDRNKALKGQEYRIIIPKQEVSGASVDYKEGLEEAYKELGKNEFFAGSIHSHPNFGASQSGIDHTDETLFPGVHITLGHIMKDPVEIHQRISMGGETYTSKEQMIQSYPPVKKEKVPEGWVDKVEKKTYTSDVTSLTGYQRTIGFNGPTVMELFNLMKPSNVVNQKNAKSLKPIITD